MAEAEDTSEAIDDQVGDTAAGTAAEDTLAADAADTMASDQAEDTVQASAGNDKSPFEQFGDPKTEAEKPAAQSAAAPPSQDELDKELEAIEAEFDVDPVSAGKKMAVFTRKQRAADKAEKLALQKQVAAAAGDADYRAFEADSGLDEAPPEVRKALTRKTVVGRFDKHFAAGVAKGFTRDRAYGEAYATLKGEIKQIIAAAPKKKPMPRVKMTDTGATLHPPGGAGGRSAKEPPNPARVFIDGNWSYPTPVPLKN